MVAAAECSQTQSLLPSASLRHTDAAPVSVELASSVVDSRDHLLSVICHYTFGLYISTKLYCL